MESPMAVQVIMPGAIAVHWHNSKRAIKTGFHSSFIYFKVLKKNNSF